MNGNTKKPDPASSLSDYEGLLRYLAEHTDLSPNQARELIDRYGNDRQTLLREAKNRKAEG